MSFYLFRDQVVIFLLSSTVFTVFLTQPNDLNTRTVIIFTILLSVIAFKYNNSADMPQVSYATILDAYILQVCCDSICVCTSLRKLICSAFCIQNFYVILFIATVSFMFTTQCTFGHKHPIALCFPIASV